MNFDRALKAAGVNKAEFARGVGYDEKTVYRWICGSAPSWVYAYLGLLTDFKRVNAELEACRLELAYANELVKVKEGTIEPS